MGSSRKNSFYKIGLLIFVLLLSFTLCILVYNYFEKILFEKLAAVVGVVARNSKDMEIKAMNQLKSQHSQYTDIGKEVLGRYGYSSFGFIFMKDKAKVIYSSFLFSFLIAFIFYVNIKISSRNKKSSAEKLKEYLETINKGDYSLSLNIDEDFAIVSDELYKTIVNLRELKEQAIRDKVNLKDNMADISHQLKTPITSINIMAELMEDCESKEENKEYIQRLSKQIARLGDLTNSLLTMSKLDTNTIEFKNDMVDIKNMIEFATEPILYLIEKKNIELNIIGDDLHIKGDTYWLSEAFLNIIKNSVEHIGEKGEINIYLKSNPIFNEVRIEDNGSGFLREDLPYIFKRFFKGKNSNKDSIGIGLSMAKTIIKKHNGEISAGNRKDGGVRFNVKFYFH